MQITITTIIFGLPTGQHTVHTCLTLPTNTLSLRDLIAHKIRQEIIAYTAHRRPGLSGEYFTPEELIRAEMPAALVPGEVDTEIARAQRAFAARDYMIVIDNQRIDDPDAAIILHPQTEVEFIKILPLVGG